MKHLNYRLLACLLSFWTLLGALAQPASALELSDTNDYGAYSTSGAVTTQGAMPEDIVKAKLPTIRSNVFDVRIDPNNVIRQLGPEYFMVDGQLPRIGAGKVFFTNIDSESGEVSLTRNSDRYTIINQGNVPLTVKMSVSVNKGSNSFTFASSPDFTDEDGQPISGPALYLALTTGPVRTATLPLKTKDPDTGVETLTGGYGATSTGWIAGNQDAFYISANRTEKKYVYALKDGVTDDDLNSTTFYMTGAINDTGWSDTMSDFSLTVTWNVATYEKGPDKDPSEEQDIRPWADTLFAAADSSDAADLYVNYGSGEFKAKNITGVAYQTAEGKAVTVSAKNANMTIDGSYVSVPATPAMYNGSDWMLIMTGETNCRVPFSLKDVTVSTQVEEEEQADCPSVTVTTPATAKNEWADLEVTFGPMTKVTSVTYLMTSGEETSTNNASNLEVNGSSVRVKAFLGMWNSSVWRLNLEDEDGAVTSLSFNLKQQGKIEQPVVITTKKATAKNDVADLKVYMNGMTEITGVRYRMTSKAFTTAAYSNTSIFPASELPKVQVKAFLGLWNGDMPSMEFKDDSGNTFSARFTLK